MVRPTINPIEAQTLTTPQLRERVRQAGLLPQLRGNDRLSILKMFNIPGFKPGHLGSHTLRDLPGSVNYAQTPAFHVGIQRSQAWDLENVIRAPPRYKQVAKREGGGAVGGGGALSQQVLDQIAGGMKRGGKVKGKGKAPKIVKKRKATTVKQTARGKKIAQFKGTGAQVIVNVKNPQSRGRDQLQQSEASNLTSILPSVMASQQQSESRIEQLIRQRDTNANHIQHVEGRRAGLAVGGNALAVGDLGRERSRLAAERRGLDSAIRKHQEDVMSAAAPTAATTRELMAAPASTGAGMLSALGIGDKRLSGTRKTLSAAFEKTAPPEELTAKDLRELGVAATDYPRGEQHPSAAAEAPKTMKIRIKKRTGVMRGNTGAGLTDDPPSGEVRPLLTAPPTGVPARVRARSAAAEEARAWSAAPAPRGGARAGAGRPRQSDEQKRATALQKIENERAQAMATADTRTPAAQQRKLASLAGREAKLIKGAGSSGYRTS